MLLTQRTVTYYITEPSFRQGGCRTTNKIATLFTTARILSWVPEELKTKTDWLTDRQLQSNSVSDSGKEKVCIDLTNE